MSSLLTSLYSVLPKNISKASAAKYTDKQQSKRGKGGGGQILQNLKSDLHDRNLVTTACVYSLLLGLKFEPENTQVGNSTNIQPLSHITRKCIV